jgi:hypothetical protein
MEYNSIIEYIKEKYPDIISTLEKDKESFIIKNSFVIGIVKDNIIYKIDIPYHFGIEDIPMFRGFTDKDQEYILENLEHSNVILKDYKIQELPYHIYYDKSSNESIPIKINSLSKIPDIIKNYSIFFEKIKNCQIKILKDKSDIIKEIKDYKTKILNYIIDNKVDSYNLKKIYKTISLENAYFENKLNLLSKYKCDSYDSHDYQLKLNEIINELRDELLNLNTQLNKTELKNALLERYKQESRDKIILEKDSIINNIRNYNYKWMNWLENSFSKDQLTGDIDLKETKQKDVCFDNYKYFLLKELQIIQYKFKELLNNEYNVSNSMVNSNWLQTENFNKLKQNIIDIEAEIKNTINNQLVQLSIKDNELNLEKSTLEDDFELSDLQNELSDFNQCDFNIKTELKDVRNLLLQNENTKIEDLQNYYNDYKKIHEDCYIIIQNFLTINNLFYRKQMVIKKLENILDNNLPPFSYLSNEIKQNILKDFKILKTEIENNINFLNLNSYINDVNLTRFKTKLGVENYYKSRSKDENDFCIHLLNIINFWNINKDIYRNQNARLINIYEDISGQIRFYLRLKPFIKTENQNPKLTNVGDTLNETRLINQNIYKDKKQCYISINSEKDNSNKIYGDFHRIFDDSYTNFNIYTGDKNTQEQNTQEQIENLEKYNHGLHNIFKELENEYSIVLFSYGNSGSGKSLSLFGDQDTPGILYYGLKNLNGVSNISLDYLFEQYYDKNDLINNKVSGKIHNLINNIDLSSLNYVNSEISVDESKEFSKILPSYIDINDINIDNFYSLLNNIDNYRKNKGRICKIPNNTNSNRSHLYMIFKIVFDNNKSSYMTVIDTASKESPNDLFNHFIDNTKTKLHMIMAPEPIGGIAKIEKTIKQDNYILDNYSPIDIFKILNESFYINETINHMLYYLNKSNKLTYNDKQQSIDKYDMSKFFISPITEMKSICNSNSLTIPILNFINNITDNSQIIKPTKFAILCCIRQEEIYYDQTISCLEFANKVQNI